MSQDLAEKKTFQDRMMEKIRTGIGDMITDDELKKLVDEGVHKAFFEPTRIEKEYGRYEEHPSWLIKFLDELLKERVRKMVDEVLKSPENRQQILEVLEKTVKAGAGQAILAAVAEKFSGDLFNFKENIRQTLEYGR
jgi:hypothetical protein